MGSRFFGGIEKERERESRETNAVCHYDGADHAGAQVALLAGGDEVGHGCVMDVGEERERG